MKKQLITFFILTILCITMVVLVNIGDTLQLVDLFFYMYTSVLFGACSVFFAFACYDTYRQIKKEK